MHYRQCLSDILLYDVVYTYDVVVHICVSSSNKVLVTFLCCACVVFFKYTTIFMCSKSKLKIDYQHNVCETHSVSPNLMEVILLFYANVTKEMCILDFWLV